MARRVHPADPLQASEVANDCLRSGALAVSPAQKPEHADDLCVLTASIAHEVNQPLSAILTNAGMCLRMLSAERPDVESARDAAQRTIRDVNRAVQIISRLRALFATREPASERVSLNRIVVDVLELVRSEIGAGGVGITCELAENLPSLAGDRIQLEQVVLNLVRNAIEAMAGTSDRRRELVVTTSAPKDACVQLSVRDTGVGFRHEAAELLFTAFYTTKAHGMGMGLSLSRSIVESHRGRLWATPNTDGHGATFTLSIPCAPRISKRTATPPVQLASELLSFAAP